MFKTDGMNKRSAIRYLETKYENLLEEIRLERLRGRFKDYGLEIRGDGTYRIYDVDSEMIGVYCDLSSVSERFEGYKKGFEQPIDILVEVEDDEEEYTQEEKDAIKNIGELLKIEKDTKKPTKKSK